MKTLGKFTRYTPTDKSRISEATFISELTGRGVIFLKDEKNVDWYDAQKTFTPDTMKVVFDDDNVIRFFSTDASMLNPVDMFVGELPLSDVPDGINIYGEWIFDQGKVVRRKYSKDELINMAEGQKKSLLNVAKEAIAPLQDAVDMNVSTKEEEQLLVEWKKYRVLLNRVNTSIAPDIEWPTVPN
ncbi:tail fiber assembly protein [Enterobacter bugandensis]|uniref:Tail fiber assembly protein n=1 Tax=Enterobacter bugandensis TaxID=881260 RepID=A0AA42PWG0_9ENTR|nr:tail fiber assembly protein [Enterobacter bugandensis]MDH1321205.1 tail fiber assembly protein [Enterobacter bugandensis]